MVGHFPALLLLSVSRHCLQLEPIWPGESRHCVVEGHCLASVVWGWPAAYARAWLTLLRHSSWLWLVLLIQERWILANQITATGWSHRQGIFFTVDLYGILLSDHNNNFSKYNKKMLQTTTLTAWMCSCVGGILGDPTSKVSMDNDTWLSLSLTSRGVLGKTKLSVDELYFMYVEFEWSVLQWVNEAIQAVFR